LNRALGQICPPAWVIEHRASNGGHRAFLLRAGAGFPCAAGREDADGIDHRRCRLFSVLLDGQRRRAGIYVSDLWVAEAARGKRLGQRLLAAVREDEGIRMPGMRRSSGSNVYQGQSEGTGPSISGSGSSHAPETQYRDTCPAKPIESLGERGMKAIYRQASMGA
jgi:GNAT superfamily N-acetyltransferase